MWEKSKNCTNKRQKSHNLIIMTWLWEYFSNQGLISLLFFPLNGRNGLPYDSIPHELKNFYSSQRFLLGKPSWQKCHVLCFCAPIRTEQHWNWDVLTVVGLFPLLPSLLLNLVTPHPHSSLINTMFSLSLYLIIAYLVVEM